MIRNEKGQVAIFIALIFQVLFLFFAMIINVGLLVHQKINLQNSVDLAAYYGAMKQAESLNAIAHINYQIRQDWKLLSWRYRIIGMGGDMLNGHPYNKYTHQLQMAGEDDSYAFGGISNDDMYKSYLNAAFCGTYIPMKPMPPGESTCRNLRQYTATPTLSIPPATGIVPVTNAIRSAVVQALNNISDRCRFVGPYNWILLSRFKVGYIRAQAMRRKTINLIALALSGVGTSEPTKDFRELGGDYVSEGIKKTLVNNLTSANRDSLENGVPEVFNSLGVDDCKGSTGSEDQPPAWLSEVNIYPAFQTVLTDCEHITSTDPTRRAGEIRYLPVDIEEDAEHPQSQNGIIAYPLLQNYLQRNQPLLDEFRSLVGIVGNMRAPFNASLGYEKNPWCNAYVGVKARTAPKIPFLPLSDVQLEAKAFAKPFGGRIGPWAYKKWSPGDMKSSGSLEERTDKLAPARIDNIANIPSSAIRDPTRIPNYSRFPGDTKGLVSRDVLGQYTQAMFESDSAWRNANGAADDTHPWIVNPGSSGDTSPDFNHWMNISRSYASENKAGDTLAYQQNVPSPAMRSLEISAVAPDIFDLTYYSIDQNFYEDYFDKIKQLQRAMNKVSDNFFILSDHGSRLDDERLKKFSVKDQIAKQKEFYNKSTPEAQNLDLNLHNGLKYLAVDNFNLLTGWVPKDAEDYNLDQSKFGKCSREQQADDDTAIPGGCINDGRVGYSVKLVNAEYLKQSDLKLGGDGTSGGPLKNPPPQDW